MLVNSFHESRSQAKTIGTPRSILNSVRLPHFGQDGAEPRRETATPESLEFARPHDDAGTLISLPSSPRGLARERRWFIGLGWMVRGVKGAQLD